MIETSSKKIYFHVGLGKTGTTFLQYRVFPKLEGLQYIQRTKYNRAKELIAKSTASKILISREFDQQLEREVEQFSITYPNTTPIIVFRKHDSYIASQYRRFLKNSYTGSFTDFFDLENDAGHFKVTDLNYCHQIDILKKHFDQEPIVLNYHDLESEPETFISSLAEKIEVSIDLKSIDFSRKHVSYNEKQLKAMRRIGKYINLRKRTVSSNILLQWSYSFLIKMIKYTLLFIVNFIPGAIYSNEQLIDELELERVSKHFEGDWLASMKFAK